MDQSSVLKVLNSVAPLGGAASWDNVGLLLEPARTAPIRRILVTNDLTPEVWAEAEKAMPDMILSYHPPIFRPIKRLVQSDWKTKILLTCAQHNVAVYSPHTALDDVDGGINDWLLKAFGGNFGSTTVQRPWMGYGTSLYISCLHLFRITRRNSNCASIRIAEASGKFESKSFFMSCV